MAGAESPFQPWLSEPTVLVHDPSNVDPEASETIIQTEKHWSLHINWQTSGVAKNGLIYGTWHLHAYLERVGPDVGAAPAGDLDLFDADFTDLDIPLTPAFVPVINYSAHLDVDSTRIKKGVHSGRIYRLVVALTYRTPPSPPFPPPGNQPGPIAAFVEGPMLQFYDSTP